MATMTRKEEAERYLQKELVEAQMRKNESTMVNALKSFFKRAVSQQEESKN